jgi:hypothetical protein
LRTDVSSMYSTFKGFGSFRWRLLLARTGLAGRTGGGGDDRKG